MTFDTLTLTLAAAILESGDRANANGTAREDAKYYANRAHKLFSAVAAKSAPASLAQLGNGPTTGHAATAAVDGAE